MKHIFTAVAFGAFAITSTAIAQPSDVDTCYSADCENGLNSIYTNQNLQDDVFDTYQLLSSAGIDGSFLFEPDRDPIKVQCFSSCTKEARKTEGECLSGLFAANESTPNPDFDAFWVAGVCKDIKKEKFKKCARENDCFMF